jgi:hypothetical protein
VWNKARFTPGHDPLQQAVEGVKRMRLLLPPDIADKRPLGEPAKRDEHDYEFFIGIAGHLQVIMGDRPIYLPCSSIGNVMGVSKVTISRYRRWAIEDGFLAIAKASRCRSKGGSEATEFRFNIHLWPWTRDKAQAGTSDSYRLARAK